MNVFTEWSEFYEACPKEGCVYRGQTQAYPRLLPSLFRLKTAPVDYHLLGPAVAKLYLKAYDAYSQHEKIVASDATVFDEETDLSPDGVSPGDIPGHGFGSPSDYSEYGAMISTFNSKDDNYRHAVLQHYGAPTPALDVTYDPSVALWFATHRYQADATRVARYYPHEATGVVYALAAPNKTVVDLRLGRFVPAFGLRGQRQAGGLVLGATASQPDLSPHFVATLYVSREAFLARPANLPKLSQNFLFPLPQEDVFFSALLDARIANDAEMRYLVSFFPVYV
jgi:hypothetical protein